MSDAPKKKRTKPTLIARRRILRDGHKGNTLYTVEVDEPAGYELIAGSVCLNGGTVRDFDIERRSDTVWVKYRPVGPMIFRCAVFTGHFALKDTEDT